MALRTLIGYRHVRPREREHRIVVKSRRHPGRLRMASRTIRWELVRRVVRVGRLVEICRMAANASVRRVVVVPVVASGAVV